MRTLLSAAVLLLLVATNLPAQNLSFMTITLHEDMRIIGNNRSFMLVTESDGTQKQRELNRIMGLGLKQEEATANEKMLVLTLNEYAQKGWKISSVDKSTIENDEGGTALNITRFILEKKTE